MKKNRTTLKDYFRRGAIPTEANFADLIDSMLNQEEDNISKAPNDPLKITATGVDEALIDFYRVEQNQEMLSWQIKQKPGGRAGLSISDPTASRLFIENGSGNIGIGTPSPTAKLQVSGGPIQLDGNQKVVFIDGDVSNNLKVQLWSGYGLGINPATLFYAADGWHSWRDASGANERMSLSTRADGGLTVNGTGNSTIAGNLGIGTVQPGARLSVVASGATELDGTARSGTLVTSAGPLGAKRGSELALATIGFTSGNSSSLGIRASRITNGTEWTSTAIGLGMDVDNTVRAGGAALWLHANGNIGIGISNPSAKLQVSGGQIQLDGNQKIVFSDSDVSNNLKVQLWTGYGLGINSGTLFYAAQGNHSWRDVDGTNERMLLTTTSDGGLTVRGTGNSTFAGNLGIGTAQPGARLSVVGPGATELDGSARSGTLVTSAGSLGTINGNELALATIGFTSSNNSSLGIRALRIANGSGWTTTAIGLGMDVDNTVRAGGAALWLHSNGNIGIGTASPNYKLEVAGDISVGLRTSTPVLGSGARLFFNGASENSDPMWMGRFNAINNISYLRMNLGDDNTPGASDQLQVGFTRGDVWNTTFYIDTLGSFTSSDGRLKEDIDTIPDALQMVKQIRGVQFHWKRQRGNDDQAVKKSFGVIAQELEAVVPNAVSTDPSGFKFVNYDSLVPVLIESIKVQQTQIEGLQTEIQDLKRAK